MSSFQPPVPDSPHVSAQCTCHTPDSRLPVFHPDQSAQPRPARTRKDRPEPAGPAVTRPPHRCPCRIFTERALCSRSPGRSSHFLPADPPSGPHTPTPRVGRKRARLVTPLACPSEQRPRLLTAVGTQQSGACANRGLPGATGLSPKENQMLLSGKRGMDCAPHGRGSPPVVRSTSPGHRGCPASRT